MLLSHYFPKILIALLGGLFIFAGIYTFGKPLLFDRLFICILLFTATICRKNINVLGVVIILVLQRLAEETAWTISELEYKDIIKALFYFMALSVYWVIKYDKVSRLLLLALVLAIAADLYWSFTEQQAPEVYWYVTLMSFYAFARHLIFMRVAYMQEIFVRDHIDSVNLDWQIYKLNALFVLLQLLMIVEYLIRGVFEHYQILYVWAIYPYLSQLFYTYLIWVVFYESYKLLIPKLLKA
ncbi:hypothetical protein [Aliiglaciecola sp. LCG003]|uniref:hypothetical protein n=1 Tax=Aliiglaciecola sp. LCG003 TaxID=3053655 RepID=UPI002573E253|nr:hypothetical protein [Aliiglaciecola sp. LCG003]WJG08328.1 hypothetical protein QR722_13385 [Aliiglaciecola sp. LCG003]